MTFIILFNSWADAQVLNPIVELLTPVWKPSKEAKEKTEIHPVIVEAQVRMDFDIV